MSRKMEDLILVMRGVSEEVDQWLDMPPCAPLVSRFLAASLDIRIHLSADGWICELDVGGF